LKFVERNVHAILVTKLIRGSTGVPGTFSCLYSAFDIKRHRKIWYIQTVMQSICSVSRVQVILHTVSVLILCVMLSIVTVFHALKPKWLLKWS